MDKYIEKAGEFFGILLFIIFIFCIFGFFSFFIFLKIIFGIIIFLVFCLLIGGIGVLFMNKSDKENLKQQYKDLKSNKTGYIYEETKLEKWIEERSKKFDESNE